MEKKALTTEELPGEDLLLSNWCVDPRVHKFKIFPVASLSHWYVFSSVILPIVCDVKDTRIGVLLMRLGWYCCQKSACDLPRGPGSPLRLSLKTRCNPLGTVCRPCRPETFLLLSSSVHVIPSALHCQEQSWDFNGVYSAVFLCFHCHTF